MLFGQFKNEIAKWFELLEAKASRVQTVAEEVVSQKIQYLHGVFSNLEAKVVVFDTDTAKEIRALVAKTEAEGSVLLKKIDVALDYAKTKAEELEKAHAAQTQLPLQGQPAPADTPAPVVDVTQAVTPAPEAATPAATS